MNDQLQKSPPSRQSISRPGGLPGKALRSRSLAPFLAFALFALVSPVAVGAGVLFSNNGKLTGGITHTLGGAGITFTIAGDYRVLYSVSATESCQFALFKNGTLILGTTYGSGAGTQQNLGQAILTLDSGDVITLRNFNSAAAVGLQTLAGGTEANVNASLVFQKLD